MQGRLLRAVDHVAPLNDHIIHEAAFPKITRSEESITI
jgi:hypothetical protein